MFSILSRHSGWCPGPGVQVPGPSVRSAATSHRNFMFIAALLQGASFLLGWGCGLALGRVFVLKGQDTLPFHSRIWYSCFPLSRGDNDLHFCTRGGGIHPLIIRFDCSVDTDALVHRRAIKAGGFYRNRRKRKRKEKKKKKKL